MNSSLIENEPEATTATGDKASTPTTIDGRPAHGRCYGDGGRYGDGRKYGRQPKIEAARG